MPTVASLTCSARFATPRTESRRTHGGQVAKLAEALRLPLMPWQRQVFDTALEIDDDGRYVYREVIVTVPRQSGKSTALLLLMAHRCITQPGARVVYTAQNRTDARKKWEDDHLPVLQSSALSSQFKVRLQNGQEAIRWSNGALWTITATTEKAGHGMTLDLPVLDEAFAQIDNRMEQAFKPAMATRTNAQFWVTSTAGTESSYYLNAKVDLGRQLVKDGVNKGVAYFEWSADPDLDLDDPANWWTFHPALGHTIGEAVIESDKASMDPMEWRRAYGNIKTTKAAHETVIPDQDWNDCADVESTPGDRLFMSVDVSPDRSKAAIAVGSRRGDGCVHGEIISEAPGTGWLVDEIVRLNSAHHPQGWVIDPAGPAGGLIPRLLEKGISPELVSGRELAQACQAFFDLVCPGDGTDGVLPRFRHLDQASLNLAVGVAKKRPVGDSWAWTRKDTSVSIAPLVAVTLAAWMADRDNEPEPEVELWTAWE